MSHDKLQSCIDAVRCAQECKYWADTCLSESDVKMMAEGIRLNKDGAVICWTAAAYMSPNSGCF